MKWIWILLIVTAAVGYLIIRYRRQLATVVRIIRLLRGRSASSDAGVAARAERVLVQCAGCGRWVSVSDALRLGSGNEKLCSRCRP